MKICKVEKCENKIKVKGYCNRHIQQIDRHGKILERTKFDKNEIINCSNYYEVVLYSGLGEQEEIARTKIDKDDLEKIKNYKWYLNDSNYVISNNVNGKKARLHQLILGKKKGLITDHKNTDRLDNRKRNLRFVTKSQNGMNRKNVKGYCWNKKNKNWNAYIMINCKKIFLGCFENKKNAIIVRRQAEKKFFGEFAYKNI